MVEYDVWATKQQPGTSVRLWLPGTRSGRGFNSAKGIELASWVMLLAGDPGRAELVGLLATRAGFRTFPQEFEAVVRR